MVLLNKIKAVERICRQADIHVARFKEKSGLTCLPGCGHCCVKPDIEATVLEFLPAAYSIFLDETYENILDRLENQTGSVCVFYNPFGKEGFCSNYPNRGLVCRLFGFSTKTDKHGNRIFVTCSQIKKTIQSTKLEKSIRLAPEMSAYYMKLYGIDPKLSIQYLPVNEAIKEALKIVITYFQYRKKPA